MPESDYPRLSQSPTFRVFSFLLCTVGLATFGIVRYQEISVEPNPPSYEIVRFVIGVTVAIILITTFAWLAQSQGRHAPGRAIPFIAALLICLIALPDPHSNHFSWDSQFQLVADGDMFGIGVIALVVFLVNPDFRGRMLPSTIRTNGGGAMTKDPRSDPVSSQAQSETLDWVKGETFPLAYGGYNVREVDDYLDDLSQRAASGDDLQAIATEARTHTFAKALRGYDQDRVRQVLTRVVSELGVAESDSTK